jgi:diaminohydroxyphosphoribosylaminopyrimidine deaminase/5-amino-6-(5-phosphoribosylamino)uracil reductase
MAVSEQDRNFMQRALRLAARGRGWVSPNPMVGAVIVRDGEVVGEGYHQRAGGPHAEVNALRAAGDAATGATMYVTLEPCNHVGRTPPCSHAVSEAGIRRVVIGMLDPNPVVNGGGTRFLQSSGIEVEDGVLERRCRILNQPFIKHITTGMPLVALKAAATLDGRIAAASLRPEAVTGEASHKLVHRLRCDLDAILVGIGTALADDPMLTARAGRKKCRQPLRVVLDSKLRLPPDSKLARTAREAPAIAACGERSASPEAEKALADAGVEVLRLPEGESGLDLTALLRELGRREVNSLLVEGGGRVHGSFLRADLADEFYFFYAPRILGNDSAVPLVSGLDCESIARSRPVYDLESRRTGGDVLLQGRFRPELY